MKKLLLGILLLLVLVVGLFWVTADKDMKRLVSNLPTNAEVLFWSIPERDAAFRAMDRIPILSKANIIEAGG